jgi:hypothetical protein
MTKLPTPNIKRASKTLRSKSLHSSRFSKANLTIFSVIFAAIGGYLIYSSFAAGPVASIEPENGTITPPASVVDDSSASGGKAVRFGPASACPVATPNVPDGPDPWGGCFPGPKTTGIPAGTVLSAYTGPCDITTNVVIDSKTISNCGDMTVRGSGVLTIKNSQLNGRVYVDTPTQGGSFTITDSDVNIGDNNYNADSIGKSHFVLTRVNVHGGFRQVWCEYDCSIKDSYTHGQATPNPGPEPNASHMSSVKLGSGAPGAGQFFTHNSIACDVPDNGQGGCSADITAYGDFATIQNNTLKNNLLVWTNGGTCAYGGSGSTFPNSTNNIWQDNIFQRGPSNRGQAGPLGHCGYWYAITSLDAGLRGNQWINNKYDDGSIMPSDG